MSEYQYYEFQAIDRPLDQAAQEALRSISSRARITATSFTNHYEWGDLKGDPRKFMERWFDLHLYLANWNTRRLMIKVPKRFVNQTEIDPFLREIDWVKVWTSGDNLIVDICRDEVEVCDDWHDGSGQLAALSPLRADVLSGDFRLFYLLWLAAVQDEFVPEDEFEPLPGIAPLTGALDGFAEFFGIDPDLVEAASELGGDDSATVQRCAAQGNSGHSRARKGRLAAARRRWRQPRSLRAQEQSSQEEPGVSRSPYGRNVAIAGEGDRGGTRTRRGRTSRGRTASPSGGGGKSTPRAAQNSKATRRQ